MNDSDINPPQAVLPHHVNALNFTCIGPRWEESILSISDSPPLSAHQELCATDAYLQRLTSLRIGLDGTITIWKPRSVLKIYVSLKFGINHDHVKDAVRYATSEWNEKIQESDVRPRFEIVNARTEATCEIKPGTADDRLAHAFFPGMAPYIHIDPPSFRHAAHRKNLWKTLLHEFGHVLGARHQLQESGAPSVLIGVDDDCSIMRNSFILPDAPHLQQSDIDSFEMLYAVAGDQYGGLRIKRIKPMLLETWEKQQQQHQFVSVNCHTSGNYPSGLVSDHESNNLTDQVIMVTVLLLVVLLLYRAATR